MTNNSEFHQIASAANIGYLGILTQDGYPRVVPINFATIGDRVYLHGASNGEKYEAFASGQKVTFSVDLPYAMIPSYWQDAEQACRATQFFKSVLIRGRGAIVSDVDERAAALQTLMKKHQAEGGFRQITASQKLYHKSLAGVTVFRIDPDRITTLIKMGEKLSTEVKAELVKRLRERGNEVDLETAAEIQNQIDQQERTR